MSGENPYVKLLFSLHVVYACSFKLFPQNGKSCDSVKILESEITLIFPAFIGGIQVSKVKPERVQPIAITRSFRDK